MLQRHFQGDGNRQLSLVAFLESGIELALELGMSVAVEGVVRGTNGEVGKGVVVRELGWETRNRDGLDS
jgi:hypothetical protein